MPGGAKKFRSKHHFGRSRKKGRGRNPNGAASASREQAPTSSDNVDVAVDDSSCVPGVDAGRTSTDVIVNRGVRETGSPDSVRSVDYDRADAIGNGEECVDTRLPDSARDVDSGRFRVDADVIGASEVREARARETATLEDLSLVSATARKIERFTDASGAATAPVLDEPPPYLIAHDDELPSADVAFDDLRAGGVLIPAEITLEGFADADKDLELCAELTDDEIIHQVTEDSDADTENEEPAPTQPTNTELTRALMTLSLVYSGNMTLTEIEADIIAGKRTMQKKISDFFAPKC
ncbi:hypothetical protein HPB52_007794 [Rhipicephalus sanguineus]|uniref:Uncharacterized protein n=1 Tax=Rhipicephalus sanguineus TaxID=34632 RepID=A0A9D4SRZ3_RHISA|nr:hypothetical protein HPB52_007794 [Rhipicephalus sanguineus]